MGGKKECTCPKLSVIRKLELPNLVVAEKVAKLQK